MRFALRLIIACLSGISGIAALLFILKPDLIADQKTWLLGAITVLLIASLVSTTLSIIAPVAAAPEALPEEASDTDRQLHGEAVKVVSQLRGFVEASGNFKTALAKASDQLPKMLKADQVQLVISYLMIENDNMRKRTADLQGNLEQSQRQIEKLKSHLAVAEEQGLSDGLTGLRNRRGFDITLAAEIASAKSGNKPLSLIIADIDHFKLVNDRYGHQTGDDVLKWFARMLSANMKGRDTVARYGGEEFAIILPQTTVENAANLAGQIKQQLEAKLWTKPGAPNTSLRITASFGVAQLGEQEGTSSLIQRADAKLYECKANGRNRVAA